MRTALAFSYGFAAALAFPSSPTELSVPSLPKSWRPGVKWQIVIHAPVDVNQTKITPTDAGVWDIDYFHAIKHPDIIPTLVSACPRVAKDIDGPSGKSPAPLTCVNRNHPRRETTTWCYATSTWGL